MPAAPPAPGPPTHLAARGCGHSTRALRVFRHSSDLKMAVEVGLVVGTMPAGRAGAVLLPTCHGLGALMRAKREKIAGEVGLVGGRDACRTERERETPCCWRHAMARGK
jgi:hypothetical protein